MPATVRYVEDPGYAEVRYFGHLTHTELLHALQELGVLLPKHGCHRLLADCLDIRTGPSISDMYQTVNDLRDEQATAPMVKQALVLPASPEAAETVGFWETVSVNRGMWAQSFHDRESALVWLLAS